LIGYLAAQCLHAWVQLRKKKSLPISHRRHQIGRLDFGRPRLLTGGLWGYRFRINFPRSSPTSIGSLTRLVHQTAARKPISDVRTATYVILSIGLGLRAGGRITIPYRSDDGLRCGLRKREGMRGDNTRTLFDSNELIGTDFEDRFLRPAGPLDFDGIHLGVRPETESQD
jgi:hypothetical protein